jgi:hypothetical protein
VLLGAGFRLCCVSRLAVLSAGSDRDLNRLVRGGGGHLNQGIKLFRSAWLRQVIRQANEA